MADHSNTFLLVTILVLATIILIAGMKYLSGARTARVAGQDGNDIRALAAEMAEIKTRLGSIEKILREVE